MLSLFVASAIAKSFQGEDQSGWVRKDHSIHIAGQNINYQTTAGMMPIRSRAGDIDGKIFFTYYKRTDLRPGAKRPVTFVFNGGPGSASVWLHLGIVGPKRPKMGTIEGFMPSPPYDLVPNDESILPESDFVTIDPVGTGYSRPTRPEDGAKFWGVDGDISSVGEFIRSFLTAESRWLSPIFIMGESYGGIRGSGLTIWMHDHGIGLNGAILLSPLIGPPTNDEKIKAPDARAAYYFPTFATSGWYHKQLSPELEKKSVNEIYDMAYKFARDEYLPALGTVPLPPEKRKEIIAKMHELTGISEDFIDKNNMRISDFRWYKELLKPDHNLMGRYDARYTGIDLNPAGTRGGPDPSYTQVQPAFTSAINDYLTNELGYQTTLKYSILGETMGGPWKYPDGPLDKSDALRQAIAANPYTKIMVAMGYYDVACPMGTNDALLDRMQLDDRLKNNIVRKRYQAGHMVYLDENCRRQFHADIASFIKSQSNPTAPKEAFKKGS